MLRNGAAWGGERDKGGVQACDGFTPATFKDISFINHKCLFVIFSPLVIIQLKPQNVLCGLFIYFLTMTF